MKLTILDLVNLQKILIPANFGITVGIVLTVTQHVHIPKIFFLCYVVWFVRRTKLNTALWHFLNLLLYLLAYVLCVFTAK